MSNLFPHPVFGLCLRDPQQVSGPLHSPDDPCAPGTGVVWAITDTQPQGPTIPEMIEGVTSRVDKLTNLCERIQLQLINSTLFKTPPSAPDRW